MLEAYGNIWDHVDEYDAVVITTNGFVKKNGEAVMGRGIALEAKNRFFWLPEFLGRDLKTSGNVVMEWVTRFGYQLVTFPVKPEFGPNGEPGWKVKADINLITNSAIELVKMADMRHWQKILMPRPGCGNGGLKWEDVKPVIEPLLDDRFTIMHFDTPTFTVSKHIEHGFKVLGPAQPGATKAAKEALEKVRNR